MDVPEAPVVRTEHGFVRTGEGWFVVNARELRWYESEGWGKFSNFGGDILFDQLGVGLTVLGPGQPMSMYHWESDEEDFLILFGTATLIIEGQERRLRQWDFVHCPPYAEHTMATGVDVRAKASTPSTRRHCGTAQASNPELRRTRRTRGSHRGRRSATEAGWTTSSELELLSLGPCQRP
jgi:uncharacterized cupin superfamily protein